MAIPKSMSGVLSRPEGDLAWLKRAAGSEVGVWPWVVHADPGNRLASSWRVSAMALTRWRVRMEIEPGRRQTMAVVASVSAALVSGGAVVVVLSPSGQLNESPIIADRDSGALYVDVGDRLYPALAGIGTADHRAARQPAPGSVKARLPPCRAVPLRYPD